jgi:hypothetical protein
MKRLLELNLENKDVAIDTINQSINRTIWKKLLY